MAEKHSKVDLSILEIDRIRAEAILRYLARCVFASRLSGYFLGLLAILSVVTFGAFEPTYPISIKSPSEFLGKPICGDGILADYNDICSYFAYLDSISDRVEVTTLGKTTLGNDLIMVVAALPEAMKDLERYRQISRQLRDAQLPIEQAEKLASQGKVIMLDMCSIHSDEVAATQMSLELGYRIASGDEEMLGYLEDVILLLIPVVNPDGHQMICDWYNKWRGTEHDGCGMPWLYHHYAGHDNNRDWYMFNLQETKLISEVMYQTWIPQVIVDHHEMWMTGARYFVPPYTDPVNPNIHPLVWRQIEVVGAQMRLTMQEKGLKGVISNALFTGWWEGASVMTPLWHNVVSLLTEAASVRIASPIYVDPSELQAHGTGFPSYTRLSNFPDPWEGGWWRLADIVEYELTSVIGALKACSANRKDLLLNFYRMGRDNIEKGRSEPPFAYAIPPQDDSFSVCRMLERLMLGGVEIHKALEPFVVDGRHYEEGTYLIYLSQPYRGYVKDMLERQRYPVIKLSPESRPLEPYDATAWTFPLKFGVRADEISKPFEVRSERCGRIDYPESRIDGNGRYLALSRKSLGAYALAARAFDENLNLYSLSETIMCGGDTLPAGTIVVDLGGNSQETKELVTRLSKGLGLDFKGCEPDKSLLKPIKKPRIAIFQPYFPNEDEGWLRYVLDDFGFKYDVLHNEDMRKETVVGKYDILVFPSIQATIIKDGKPQGRWAQYFEPPPKAFQGGIGDEGIKVLRNFIEKGGVTIAIGSACDLFIDELGLPVSDILKDDQEHGFACPGAILRLRVDPTNPICYGMEPEIPCFFFYGKAFATRIPFGKFTRTIVARFADTDLLLSGWLSGEDTIEGKAAVVSVGVDKGKIILVGFDPIHRAQTYSTFKVLLNSFLVSKS